MGVRPSPREQLTSISIVRSSTVIPFLQKETFRRRESDPGRYQSHTQADIRHEGNFISPGVGGTVTHTACHSPRDHADSPSVAGSFPGSSTRTQTLSPSSLLPICLIASDGTDKYETDDEPESVRDKLLHVLISGQSGTLDVSRSRNPPAARGNGFRLARQYLSYCALGVKRRVVPEQPVNAARLRQPEYRRDLVI
jgi:hypothetical protein